MIRIHWKLMKRVRRFCLWIWQQDGTPAQRARGISVGVFSGCFPFFGLQSLLGIALASLFKGNQLLAITGTWISNPFTYIPLYLLNYKVGELLLGKYKQLPELSELIPTQIWNQGWVITSRLLLGSFIVGSSLAAIVGYITYLILKHLKVRKFQ